MIRDFGHWREHLARHLAVALEGKDPEGVHQVRVAARRLRALLELSGQRALVADLRDITRALGPAMDLHLVEDAPPLRAWLGPRQRQAQDEVVRALGSPRMLGLVEALGVMPTPAVSDGKKQLGQLNERVQRSLDRVKGRKDLTGALVAVHRLRRDIRRLRYAREWLGLDAALLAEAQEELGALCDGLALKRLVEEWGRANDTDVTRVVRTLERALRTHVPGPKKASGAKGKRKARPPAKASGARKAARVARGTKRPRRPSTPRRPRA